MKTPTEKVIEKILALKAKTPEKGATEAECKAAIEKAAELMAKYQIKEEDLAKLKFEKDFRKGEFQYKQKQEHPVVKFCQYAIGKFCGVKTWRSTWQRKGCCAGLNADVEMFEYLMALIHDAMELGWKEWLKQNPKQPGDNRHAQYWGFMGGFGASIREKLEEMTPKEQVGETGKSLIVLKNALVEDYCKTLDLNLRTSTSKGLRVDMKARAGGQAAGAKVNLNRPMTGKASQTRLAA